MDLDGENVEISGIAVELEGAAVGKWRFVAESEGVAVVWDLKTEDLEVSAVAGEASQWIWKASQWIWKASQWNGKASQWNGKASQWNGKASQWIWKASQWNRNASQL